MVSKWKAVLGKLFQDPVFLLHITVPVLVAVISAFLVSEIVSGPEFLEETVASIDESKDDVLKLAGSATAVSVAITALPGDIATPIAGTLAELNTGFLVVVCALYLEKFLMSVMGVIVFKWLIPVTCLVYAAGYVTKNRSVRLLSLRIGSFALAIFVAIPIGAEISGLIREQYGETIDRTIESAESSAGLIEESVEDGNIDGEAGNGLGRVLQSLQQAGDSMARGTSQFMKYLEKLVNRFIEAVAVMIVTSCVIPVLVILGLIWLSKIIFTAGSANNVKIMDTGKAKEQLRLGAKDEKENS